ncbi:DUF2232 domain-containing protein [Hartmannibacter diazotrophicus]|nr:DUF2232 domain-containing protein [Hartmannibacter diazotrophicus]
MNSLLIGILSGLAAAALFAAPYAGGGFMTLPLPFISALPIVIASLGWGTTIGLVSVAVATLVAAVHEGPIAAGLYLVIVGLPAAGYSYLYGLARPGQSAHANGGEASGMEWFPYGKILVVIAALSAITAIIAFSVSNFSVDTFVNESVDALRDRLDELNAQDSEAFVETLRFYVSFFPFFAGLGLTASMALTLWLGGLVVRYSGRFSRPSDNLPETLRLPPALVFVAAGSAFLSVEDGSLGFAMRSIAGAATMVLAISGYALAHLVARRGRGGRFALYFLYVLTVTFFLLPVSIMTLFGALDTLVGLRRRILGARPSG